MSGNLCAKAPSLVVFSLIAAFHCAAQQPAHKIDASNLAFARVMLHTAEDDVKKHYYDPKYHGVDLETRFEQYDAKLPNAGSLNEAMRIIAAYLDGLKDSHTFFLPPPRPYSFESGYRMAIFGDQCFVTRVRPKTDAAEKLQPGDRILKFNGFDVNRADFQDIQYVFNVLNPAPVSELDVQAFDGTRRHVSVKATVIHKKRVIDLSGTVGDSDYWDLIRLGEDYNHLSRSTITTIGDIAYWKMPGFNLDPAQIDTEFAKVKKVGNLVLDLRGDPGGYTETLKAMIGNLFDHEVKIADRVARKDSKPMIAKPRSGHPFTGKVIVLIDSQSASAAESFARVMQLEKRGTVLGDTSAGAVMESIRYSESSGGNSVVPYGFSITDADLIMTDGKSLEKIGVIPDLTFIPGPKDLASGHDPVLSRASAMSGGQLTSEQAGKLFPFEWEPL
jgi:C-terminal processing protease CtpA/Prc